MTDHAELRRLAKAATPGPWRVQTGCSWRRIGTDSGDGDVLRPCTHPHDGWPDIVAPAENLKYIASANPKTVLALLDEIDRLKAENDALRKFSAEAYQVLGALDAPENVLDNASDAANGVPLRHETLLPFFAEDYEALRKDAARYRWLIASAWYVGPEPNGDTEAVSWHDHNDTMHGVTTAIDAAIEGAKQ
ncbi:TPA: ead/Ea22-like family protein [Pseudomonas aeruginosa]|uniref:ead/Ea22-like family protein n=1 Tax=Pseudomonas aeruginosa TaxID=287 RepID=UPI0009975661|nr:ead/Ea22-like family protein [Pseudomonas aeruginosa]ELN5418192.1 ead/Ea22-like family protein [Pseudomonas aeruginosa]EME0456337.1 ead/Ea22-like family protein [Pseudomonas aeruginosa]MCM8605463.1 ead/Ea22-like family protein [Pseudomonas aeruginosa]MCM8646994.1 ead/Ea22-like family protein [Pseudomonas aeruginosa]MCM8660640.1 ead/Ea22-like family protein [Pseudomonas aeruginosa]